MTGTNRLSSALSALAMLGIGALVAGCGGFGPGDYKIYDVVVGHDQKSSGCYFPNSGPDPNSQSDSTDQVSPATWYLTAGPSSAFYLDAGPISLAGTKNDTGYDFTTTKTDVNYDGDVLTGTKRTDRTVIDISVTTDGKTITGTVTNKTSHSCSGNNCGNSVPSCVITNDFSGAEISDVKLEHDPVHK
jgi:hypothetical protein